jgi:hypothetical protein
MFRPIRSSSGTSKLLLKLLRCCVLLKFIFVYSAAISSYNLKSLNLKTWILRFVMWIARETEDNTGILSDVQQDATVQNYYTIWILKWLVSS